MVQVSPFLANLLEWHYESGKFERLLKLYGMKLAARGSVFDCLLLTKESEG